MKVEDTHLSRGEVNSYKTRRDDVTCKKLVYSGSDYVWNCRMVWDITEQETEQGCKQKNNFPSSQITVDSQKTVSEVMSVPVGQQVVPRMCPSGKPVGQQEMSTYLSSVQWAVQFDPCSMSHCCTAMRIEPLTPYVLLTLLMALWVDPVHRPLATDN